MLFLSEIQRTWRRMDWFDRVFAIMLVFLIPYAFADSFKFGLVWIVVGLQFWLLSWYRMITDELISHSERMQSVIKELL